MEAPATTDNDQMPVTEAFTQDAALHDTPEVNDQASSSDIHLQPPHLSHHSPPPKVEDEGIPSARERNSGFTESTILTLPRSEVFSGPLLPPPIPMTMDTPLNKLDPLKRESSLPHQLSPTLYATVPGSTSTDRPLDVKDALSYLDAVKMRFQDQPEVYNRFLDIMKDFKSQQIDTPGVIKRVSHLFNGHPSLIQGFNTFLPVGYRIECSTDANDANFITVTTPTGTMMQTTNNGPGNDTIMWSTSMTSSTEPIDTIFVGVCDTNGNSLNPSASQDLSGFTWDGHTIEPAVQYVQKIKQRCNPETYKRFLEILSRHHHSPDAIDEKEVSAQISELFKDAPDLRSDFRIFMPEKKMHQLFDDHETGVYALEPRDRDTTPLDARSVRRKMETSMAPPPSPGTGSTLPQKRKRRPPEREREHERDKDVPSERMGSSNHKLKSQHTIVNDMPSTSRNYATVSSPRRSHQMAHSHRHRTVSKGNDDSHFFDNVKRVLDNRDVYNEFLKVVNLFTQGHIDTATLVKESRNFLGDTELMKQFKEILGWDERKEKEVWIQEPQHTGLNRPSWGSVLDRRSRADMNIQYGSYRPLPASEINVPCSGRDEMCRSVLNDEWVSHPTWSSEDSGFVAHKKNVYEEALHRSEEERHEYDFHIEAIARTIAMLEPINNKITQLTLEERGNFKLKPNLGVSGRGIYQRVVRKIYGRESGSDVIQAMQDSPAQAIPVVLNRLKLKEEEWKRAQREWNKVWREVDARNYRKSLDHQGITIKTSDKKAITTKAFVSQIEAAMDEQKAKRASLIDPLFARSWPRHQLEFTFEDGQVLQDAMKLSISFLDRTQAQINFVERKKIEGFLRSFVSCFFVLDPVSVTFVGVQETVDSDMSDDVDSIVDDGEFSSNASSISRAGRNYRKGGTSGGDLRKRLLKSEQAKSAGKKTRAQEASSPSISRVPSPVISDSMDVDGGEEARKEPLHMGTHSSGDKHTSRKYIFFSSNVFYTLIRLLETVYSRLAIFQGIAAKLASQSSNPRQPNPVAQELGLLPLPDRTSVDDRFANAERYYELLLDSCEKLFDGEIEQHAFEDQMRSMFGIKYACKIFTIDKLVGAIIKQVQAVFADTRNLDLFEILKRERAMAGPTTQDQINNRRNAEKIMGPDENLYRIDWVPESRTVTFQLFGKNNTRIDDSEVSTGRWQAYIEAFVSRDGAECVPPARVKRPFLRKNLFRASDNGEPDIISRGALEIKVCVLTYRLFFVPGTEDFLWRVSSPQEVQEASVKFQARTLQRRKWIVDIDSNASLPNL